MSAPENGGTALHVRVVRSGDTRPVPDATLTVLDGDGTQVVRGSSTTDGTFRTGLPRPGEYLLIAAAPGHEPRSATLSLHGPGEHVVDIALPGRHGLVTGTVVGPAGPVAGATVVLHDVRGEVVATAVTEEDGGYAIGDLSPAVYTVVAVAPDTEPVTESVVVDTSGESIWDPTLVGAAPVAPASGGPATDGPVGPGTGLSGTARTADGRPVPDARVAVLTLDGTAVAITDADADGRYAFGDLAPGDYTVITTGYPPTTDVLRLDGHGATHDPVLRHPG